MASTSCSHPAAVGSRSQRSAAAPGKKQLTCLCSPTNHPGSFRCSRHRNSPRGPAAPGSGVGAGETAPAPRGSRAAGKGRSVRALLLQRISPCDRDRQRQRRRDRDFQPRPSRLRLMNM